MAVLRVGAPVGAQQVPSSGGPSQLPNVQQLPPFFSNVYSIAFDGVDERIELGDMPTFDGVSSATWSLWFRRNGGGAVQGLWEKTAGTVDSFGLRVITANTRIVLHDGTGTVSMDTSGNVFTNNVWHHLCVVFDGSLTNADRVIVYRNGSRVSTGAVPTWPATLRATSTAVSVIGSSNTSGVNPMTGWIDECAAWPSFAASEAQATELYNAGTPGDLNALSFGGPSLWYRMGDGATFPTIPNVGSTSGWDGTMTNMEAGDIEANVP